MKGEYEKHWALITNANLLALLGMGFLSIFVLYDHLAYIYLSVSLIVIFILLRKTLCTHCFYYNKWCSTGWGKLSALLFNKKSGNYELGKLVAGLIWPFVMGLPLIILVYTNVMFASLYAFGL